MARISNLDFYAILGVHPNAEDIVIRAAFKALAQRYHPDRFNGSNDEAHRRMADLTNAYETLADPARRRKYDRRRGLTARQARFYFKNPARERQPPFTAFALRAAARKAQYYRNAVFVLMVVVVILSAFNVHQHAAQIRDLFTFGRASSGAVAVATPGATAPTASPASADPAQATTTANVRVLPIGQGTTRPIGPSVSDPPATALPAPDSAAATSAGAAPRSTPSVAAPVVAPSVVTPAPAPSAVAPAVVSGQDPAPAVAPLDAAHPPSQTVTLEPVKAAVAPPPVAPPSDASRAPARTATVEPHRAVAAAPRDAKHPVPAKPAAVQPAESERPARPAAAEADRCSPELVALGLCNRSSTSKGP